MDRPPFDGPPFDNGAFERVVAEVRPLSEAFAAAGYHVYLVGGIVRDLIAGRQRRAPDIDLTTDATPEEIERVLGGRTDALWKQGARFGTIGCRVGQRVFARLAALGRPCGPNLMRARSASAGQGRRLHHQTQNRVLASE